MSIFNVLTLLGGLSLFLFGMSIMGTALENRAGNKLKTVLGNLTCSPVKGFALGLGVTAIMQSSSATTVMVVGFVNSGIMELRQCISIIMGANLGTSMTSWVLSLAGLDGEQWWIQILKPSSFTPVLGLIGIAMYIFAKSSKRKSTAMILLGFTVLMYGMETMSSAVAPLAEVEEFRNMLTLFSNPILGVLVGALFTAAIQSSSASVGILQSLTQTGCISYNTAIPVIMGQNIGTCISAIISCIGTSKNAKRAAVIHLSFNVIAMLILLPGYYIINRIFQFSFASQIADELGIAVVHTVFKLLALALLIPFTKQLEKLACLVIRDSDRHAEAQLLDERLLNTPSVAVERCKTVAGAMAEISVGSLHRAMTMLSAFDDKECEAIRKDENTVDSYEDMLGTYLVKLSSQSMGESDSAEATKLLHIIGDFERISDHAVNIVESAEEINDKKLSLSNNARKELAVMISSINEILDLALYAFLNSDTEKAALIEPLEEVVDLLRDELKKKHIARLQRGECTIELGFVLSDLLINLERVSDHCSNIGSCVTEMSHESLDLHNYTNRLKADESDEYKRNYDYYRMKYALTM